ncbi:MAG: sulfotransferase domain-containing protein [Planctomycetota bacterium]
MSLTKTLENAARTFLPPPAARLAKRAAVGPRYAAQARQCRRGFAQYGDRYPQRVIFVAGLPKSGTTWLERMLGSFPGFHDVMIPDVASHELRTGGSHDYDLPQNTFERFGEMLVLLKMHVHGSMHNVEVLQHSGVRYAVLFRDLRDVAVSNFFYVRNTPWHPEHPHYAGRSIEEGLGLFADRTLPAYEAWVRSWDANRDPESSVVLRYEEMLENACVALRKLVDLFELRASDDEVAAIVEANSFKRLSAGRGQGQESGTSFFRKGVAGDWVNHFTPELKERYKAVIGRFLVDYGYEQDLSW